MNDQPEFRLKATKDDIVAAMDRDDYRGWPITSSSRHWRSSCARSTPPPHRSDTSPSSLAPPPTARRRFGG